MGCHTRSLRADKTERTDQSSKISKSKKKEQGKLWVGGKGFLICDDRNPDGMKDQREEQMVTRASGQVLACRAITSVMLTSASLFLYLGPNKTITQKQTNQ